MRSRRSWPANPWAMRLRESTAGQGAGSRRRPPACLGAVPWLADGHALPNEQGGNGMGNEEAFRQAGSSEPAPAGSIVVGHDGSSGRARRAGNGAGHGAELALPLTVVAGPGRSPRRRSPPNGPSGTSRAFEEFCQGGERRMVRDARPIAEKFTGVAITYCPVHAPPVKSLLPSRTMRACWWWERAARRAEGHAVGFGQRAMRAGTPPARSWWCGRRP